MSTPEQAVQGDSLENQEIIGKAAADRRGWNLLKVFEEPYTGRKSKRPMVEVIIDFIRSSSAPVHYYLFKDIERFTRAGVKEYIDLKSRIEAEGVAVVDSYGLIQPKQNTLEHLGFKYDWSEFSPSEAAEIMEAYRSQQDVRIMLTRMIGAEIQLVQKGYKISSPNDGYLNKRIAVEGKKRYIEVPDPKRARFFKEMFRLRASGRYTDTEIVQRLNDMGYRSKSYRRWSEDKTKVIGHTRPKPLTQRRLRQIISKTIYCGVRCEKWTNYKPIRVQYEGLVSIETFNKANHGRIEIKEYGDELRIVKGEQLRAQPPKRLKANPLYPYKNIVMCPECGNKPLLGSASKGRTGKRYPAYHCDRGHYFRIPKKNLESTVESFLSSIALSPQYLVHFRHMLERAFEKRGQEMEQLWKQSKRNTKALDEEIESAVTTLLQTKSSTARAKIEERIEELEAEKLQATQTTFVSDVRMSELDAFLRWTKKLMEPARLLKKAATLQAQTALAGLIFKTPPSFAEIANGTAQLSEIFRLNSLFTRGKALIVGDETPGSKRGREFPVRQVVDDPSSNGEGNLTGSQDSGDEPLDWNEIEELLENWRITATALGDID